MKPGYKTTEFWLTLFGIIAPAVIPGVTPDLIAGTAAALIAVYTSWRGIVKARK